MKLYNLFLSPLEQFDIKPIHIIYYNDMEFTFFDIIIPLLLIFSLLSLHIFLRHFVKLVPMVIQLTMENILDFILDIIKKQINNKAFIYIPFIITIFFIVLFSNLLSLIPFGISMTSHLIILLWFSLGLGVACFFLGFYKKGISYLKIFVPHCPLVLLPVLIIIELFSFLIRSFSLAIRLTANMLAGHTLMIIIILFLLSMSAINFIISTSVFFIIVAVTILELGVCCLQAYVITILTCIYINEAYSNHH